MFSAIGLEEKGQSPENSGQNEVYEAKQRTAKVMFWCPKKRAQTLAKIPSETKRTARTKKTDNTNLLVCARKETLQETI